MLGLVTKPLEPAAKITIYFHGCRKVGRKERVAIYIVICDVSIWIWKPIVGHNKLFDLVVLSNNNVIDREELNTYMGMNFFMSELITIKHSSKCDILHFDFLTITS